LSLEDHVCVQISVWSGVGKYDPVTPDQVKVAETPTRTIAKSSGFESHDTIRAGDGYVVAKATARTSSLRPTSRADAAFELYWKRLPTNYTHCGGDQYDRWQTRCNNLR
jgi:hypothetical protein